MSLQSLLLTFVLVCALVLPGAAVALNSAPILVPPPLYSTYPGYPIEIALSVTELDGDELVFAAEDLPAGSTFDSDLGVFTWQPASDQLGTFEIPVSVTDDGEPPLGDATVIILHVSPSDACFDLTCDPALGCEESLPAVDDQCCFAEPADRVAEPDVDCPDGSSLILGRNVVGFGQLENCDRLRVSPLLQGGGTNVSFHVAARCVNDATPVAVTVSLQTYMDVPGGVDGPEIVTLLDPDASTGQDASVRLFPRGDGFSQRLQLIFRITNQPVTASTLDGQEAELRVTLTDDDGVTLERTVRVTLTDDPLADIPEPDEDDVIPDEPGCVGCHRPLNQVGVRHGIEVAHPWGLETLTCTDCHGGQGSESTRAAAHVTLAGDDPHGFIKNYSSDELDALSDEYLRFVNPGDLRIADQTCGEVGCHPQHVENLKLSTMATYAGHYTLPRYLAGSQDRNAIYAAVDVTDTDYDSAEAPPGAVESLDVLRGPAPGADRTQIATAVDDYLPKACPSCHLNSFGPNDAKGSYRSSGCTACHMVYEDDGFSYSQDPTSRFGFTPHPARHELTTAIPTEQCAHCHFQGGRIGLSYRGIREGGFSPEKTPPNAEALGESIYGHDVGFYFVDEDTTNTHDETPPDLHHTAGMVCRDCHVGSDVHGDGNLYVSERYQVGIRCEDCHGTVRQTIEEDPDDGFFKNSRGDALSNLRRDGADRIYLQLAMEDRELLVPQIKLLLDFNVNEAMTEAMGVKENDFSHTDSIECYTCHTAWQQACFGCHVTVDDRGMSKNKTTGETTVGAISAVRDDYSISNFTLGLNARGKISPLCTSMSLFMSYIDEGGQTVYQDQPRTTHDGLRGFGWNPFHFHTVTKNAKGCESCHPAGDNSNANVLKRTYGFGDGSVLVEDGNGTVHDLTQFLDETGELLDGFAHPGTGPVPQEIRERAMAVVVPEPAALVLQVVSIAVLAGLRRRSRSSTRGGRSVEAHARVK